MPKLRFTSDAPAWERLQLAVEAFPVEARPILLNALLEHVQYSRRIWEMYRMPEGPPAPVTEFPPKT